MLAFATAWTPTASGSSQGGVLGGEAVRDLQQQRFAQQHALGIGADIVVGIADALRALRRQQRRQRADFGAGLELARRVRPIVEHLATEFVAEHDIARKVHRLAAGEMS
jgi:succinyl-CoA synthetase alpha subunit